MLSALEPAKSCRTSFDDDGSKMIKMGGLRRMCHWLSRVEHDNPDTTGKEGGEQVTETSGDRPTEHPPSAFQQEKGK